MEAGKSHLREMAKEEYRIQNALKALGYYAYRIDFHTSGSIRLEARELCSRDDELFARAAADIEKYG